MQTLDKLPQFGSNGADNPERLAQIGALCRRPKNCKSCIYCRGDKCINPQGTCGIEKENKQ